MPALALRISYAGELGWELYTPTEHGRYLWDQLFDAGADLGVVACGTGAFNSLRMEKGYRFAGVDMTREHTPFEAGLGFTVHFTKPRFNGREAALAARARGPRKRLRCLVLDDVNATCYGGEPLMRDGHAVGYVTSADFGYTVGPPHPARLAAAGARARGHGGRHRHLRRAPRRDRDPRAALRPERRAPARADDRSRSSACTESARVRESHAHSFPTGSRTQEGS